MNRIIDERKQTHAWVRFNDCVRYFSCPGIAAAASATVFEYAWAYSYYLVLYAYLIADQSSSACV